MDLSEKELIKQLEEILPSLPLSQKEVALEYLRKTKVTKARSDFYVFLRLLAPLMIPDGFKDGAHLKIFANELERIEKAVVKGEKEKLQIFLPPGSMKTLTCCLFVAWVLGRHPEWYILHIGHTASFAKETFGQKIKDIITLNEYKEIFPETKISKTTKAKDLWKTTAGGVYHATGATNAIAGKRAHIAICDDVLSEQTAKSKLERGKINRWYIPGLRSRLLPNGSEIIVNTRWNLDDLSGFIIKVDNKAKQKPWRIVAVPAILEGELGEKAAKKMGLPIGGSFWPEYWPLETLLNTKATATTHDWNALYMQNPASEEGSVFKKGHFQLWDTIENRSFPAMDYVIISLDTAFSTRQTADCSAFGVWGVYTKEVTDMSGKDVRISALMLIEAGKDRWTYPELISKIHELNDTYKPRYIVIEKKASGQSVLQDLIMQGLPVVPFETDTDKIGRAHATIPFLEAGLIWIPEHEIWAKDFMDECMNFPYGEHDDQVDQFTQAVMWLRDNMQLKRQEYAKMSSEDEEEEELARRRRKRQTYWRAAIRRR